MTILLASCWFLLNDHHNVFPFLNNGSVFVFWMFDYILCLYVMGNTKFLSLRYVEIKCFALEFRWISVNSFHFSDLLPIHFEVIQFINKKMAFSLQLHGAVFLWVSREHQHEFTVVLWSWRKNSATRMWHPFHQHHDVLKIGLFVCKAVFLRKSSAIPGLSLSYVTSGFS